MARVNHVVGALLRLGLTWLSRSRLPQTKGTLKVPGLSQPVEVTRDRWGVPHIYAGSSNDLFFAQGFVHAQDRLWQMELNRRTATGTLGELFGDATLDTDRVTRTFGLHRLAATDWANADEHLQGIIRAYTEGINAFLLSSPKMPVEFTLLRHRPNPWTPEDTLAIARLLIWQLAGVWYGKLIRALLIRAVGPEHAAELDIRYPASNPATLHVGIEVNMRDLQDHLGPDLNPFLRPGMASNAWAVSGHRTVSGKPILCNDPHLQLSIPSIWYENHLVGGEFNVTGVSLPGVPLVLLGHNARIAWGMTVAFTDCQDLFLEEFDPQNPHRYRFQDGWLDAETITECIPVKGRAKPYIHTVTVTRHGPVISESPGEPGHRLVLSSPALQPSSDAKGFALLNQAENWEDFSEALRHIQASQQNVVYADIEGNIGYRLTGRVPIRAKTPEQVPVPGWDGEHEWTDSIPFEEMPHALNPKLGYIVSCNNRIVPDDYHHYLGSSWHSGYRAQRISEAIEAVKTMSPKHCEEFQKDLLCLPGLEFIAKLADLPTEDPDVELALAYLRRWDGYLTTDSVGGAIYEVAQSTLLGNLLKPVLGQELARLVMGQGFHPLYYGNEFGGHDADLLLRLLDNPDSWWVSHAGGREALVTRSLKETVQWLKSTLGPEPDKWTWGRIHRISLGHVMGTRKPLDMVFNRGPLPVGGDVNTPCMATLLGMPYTIEARPAVGASFRQIVDMSKLSEAMCIHPPGQSGHIGSPHYDDLLALWSRGEYHPMLWTRDQVERYAESTLHLMPL